MSNHFIIKKRIANIVILLTISLLLEGGLFQIPYWKNLKNDSIEVPLDSIGVLSGGVDVRNQKISFDTKESAVTIYIPINGFVKSIQIDCSSKDEPFRHNFGTPHIITERELVETNVLSLALYPEDIYGNVLSYNEEYLMVNDSKSNIFEINSSNQNAVLCITFLQDEYMEQSSPIELAHLILNPPREFSFSFVRWITVLITLLFTYELRPSSDLWKKKFDSVKRIQYVLVMWVLFQFILWESLNPTWWNGRGFVDSYGELTRTLANGHVALDYTPDPRLCIMDNPYDYYAREELGVEYLFDYAFFEGKYYVYFGIVPALVFLPYYLLTGNMISYVWVFNIMLGLFLLGLAKALSSFGKRYFQHMSVAEYIVLYFLWVILSFVPLLFFSGYNYIFPQIFAAAFLIWGIYFYIEAGRKEGKCLTEISLGSLCMALIAGCRPQLTLCASLAFPLLKKKMCKRGTGIQWIVFWIPFVMFAIPLMVYNKVRFNSVFDFGAFYNLTNGNIHDAKVSYDSILGALRYYLLTGWEFDKTFPFIQLHSSNIELPNVSAMDLTAGYLVSFPIVLFSVFYWPSRKKSSEKKELLLIQGLLLLLSFVMICVATFYLSQRYVFDFAPLLGMATVISFLVLFQDDRCMYLKRFIILCAILMGTVYLFLFGLTKKLDTLNIFYLNRDVWFKVSKLVQFWK